MLAIGHDRIGNYNAKGHWEDRLALDQHAIICKLRLVLTATSESSL